jgi:hypothetical protein
VSAALASATPSGATTGDPIDDEFVDATCAYDDTAPDDPEFVEEEVVEGDAGEGAEAESELSLHTGDEPKQPEKDAEEDVDPRQNEWYDEDVSCGDGDDADARRG